MPSDLLQMSWHQICSSSFQKEALWMNVAPSSFQEFAQNLLDQESYIYPLQASAQTNQVTQDETKILSKSLDSNWQ